MHIRVPGEAQKIEKIMEEFGRQYYNCNSKKVGLSHSNTCGLDVSKLKSPDSIVTLAFAIMMLNTDLHTPNIKGKAPLHKRMQPVSVFLIGFKIEINLNLTFLCS